MSSACGLCECRSKLPGGKQRPITNSGANMTTNNLSFNTRKSICNHLGDNAGSELAEFLQSLKTRLEAVERNKVEITKIVPDALSATGQAVPRPR